FGHPEVYIMALPGFGIVMEIIPVFTRKPLFAYRVAAAGMLGVALLSFFVWQHHLFQSGINPDMRPLFMLTTELISIPTGFLYLVTLGTLWKAKIRFEVPMLFCLGMLFNFLIGGVTGVFLSDVPVDVTVHGSFFVMAHFHYTIMGGLIFALFGGLYYLLRASFLIFVFNFVWSFYIDPVKAADNPWDSRGLEWQTATPVPWFDFERIPVVLSDPYHYGESAAPPVADLGVPSLVSVGVIGHGQALSPRDLDSHPDQPGDL